MSQPRITIEEARKAVSIWEAVDWRTKGYDEIINGLCAAMPTFMARVSEHRDLNLYRIRRNSGPGALFESEGECWCPPNPGMGRVNRPSVRVLYTCDMPIVALEETNLLEGEYYTIFQYKLRRGYFSDVMYKQKNIPEYGIDKDVLKIYQNFSRNIMSRVITKGYDDEFYKITESFASTFMDLPNVSGFKYPSVANFHAGSNFAIKDEVVRSSVRLMGAKFGCFGGCENEDPIYGFTHASTGIHEGRLEWQLVR